MRKLFGIMFLVVALVGCAKMVKTLSNGGPPKTGNKSYDAGQKVGMFLGPIVFGLVGLWMLMGGESESTSPSTSSRDTVSPFSHASAPSVRTGTAYPMNPARTRLNGFKWFFLHPGHVVFLICGLALGAWLALSVHTIGGLVVCSVVVLVMIRSVREIKSMYWEGEACPAVVLSAERGLVAALGNMDAATGAQRPAIKIIKQPLKRIPGVQDNMRLVAAAYYNWRTAGQAWKDFSPEVIQCFIDDPNEVQRAMDSISEAEWLALDHYASRLPALTPGIYRFWGGKLKAPTSPTGWLTHKATLITVGIFGSLVLCATALHLFLSNHDFQPKVISNRQQPSAPESPWQNASSQQSVASGNFPKASALASAPAAKQIPSQVELGNQLVTFTNLEGRIYENVTLIRADGQRLIYQADGGGGSIPLNKLSLEFLNGLGIPTNWPAVMIGRKFAAETSVSTKPERPPGDLAVGDTVEVYWAGRMQSGTIVSFRGPSVQVRVFDPRLHFPLWMSTNQVHRLR